MGKNRRRKIQHLLIVRLSAMGDVAMTVPVILALKDQYPNVKITVLTRSFFAPMFSQLENVEVYEAEVKGKHKGVRGLWHLYKALKKLNIDAVADLHNVLRSNILKMYFSLGGTPFVQIDKGRREKKALTAPEHKIFKPLKTTHQRYADVFETLGFPLDMKDVSLLPKKKLASKTHQKISADTKKWIGIAPFAAFEGKMYPWKLMEEVVVKIAATTEYKILLFGGKTDAPKLQQWADRFDHCLNMAGKVTFGEELALISQLDLMLAMDSGNAHISAMYGVPTVTLWGITHPYAGFYPFGQHEDNALLADREQYPHIPTSVYGNKMPEGYEKAMESIKPMDVFKKIEHLLKNS